MNSISKLKRALEILEPYCGGDYCLWAYSSKIVITPDDVSLTQDEIDELKSLDFKWDDTRQEFYFFIY